MGKAMFEKEKETPDQWEKDWEEEKSEDEKYDHWDDPDYQDGEPTPERDSEENRE